jgi:hypothetical protein
MNPNTEHMKHHKMPQGTRCPACGLMVEGATPVEQRPDSKMKIGNVMVCVNCAVVSQVTPDGLRQMTNDQINKLPNQLIGQLQSVVAGVRAMLQSNGKN